MALPLSRRTAGCHGSCETVGTGATGGDRGDPRARPSDAAFRRAVGRDYSSGVASPAFQSTRVIDLISVAPRASACWSASKMVRALMTCSATKMT